MKFSAIVLGLALSLGTASAFAHEQHCHAKGEDGKWTDLKDVKDEAGCKEKNGVWKHHHMHCHSADGKHTDIKEAKTEKACKKAKGEWSDHGHEENEG